MSEMEGLAVDIEKAVCTDLVADSFRVAGNCRVVDTGSVARTGQAADTEWAVGNGPVVDMVLDRSSFAVAVRRYVDMLLDRFHYIGLVASGERSQRHKSDFQDREATR